MDATCAPADIKYPTDLNLVNEARELTETVIDKLRERCGDRNPRPRTKREICRKRYLEIIKHPKCGVSKRRGALRFLLNAIRRNLEFIAKLSDRCGNIPQIISEQLIVIRPFTINSERCWTIIRGALMSGLSVCISHMFVRSCVAKPDMKPNSERN